MCTVWQICVLETSSLHKPHKGKQTFVFTVMSRNEKAFPPQSAQSIINGVTSFHIASDKHQAEPPDKVQEL